MWRSCLARNVEGYSSAMSDLSTTAPATTTEPGDEASVEQRIADLNGNLQLADPRATLAADLDLESRQLDRYRELVAP